MHLEKVENSHYRLMIDEDDSVDITIIELCDEDLIFEISPTTKCIKTKNTITYVI